MEIGCAPGIKESDDCKIVMVVVLSEAGRVHRIPTTGAEWSLAGTQLEIVPDQLTAQSQYARVGVGGLQQE
jgi:hypothetical protein